MTPPNLFRPLPDIPVDVNTPILVLRRSVGPFQHCLLAVARSAGRLGIPVYAMPLSRGEPACRTRYLRGRLAAAAPEEEWIEGLVGQRAKLGRAILLPIDDLAAVAVGDHQARLGERFLLPDQPAGIQRQLASKRELWMLCQRLGVATPRSSFPQSESELIEQAASHGYPVVIKRAEPWFAPRDPTAPSVYIARTPGELRHAYARMESAHQPQVVLQDWIPGDSDSVWMFNGYFGRDGDCLCAFTGRKLRQRGPRTGPTSLGVCQTNDGVIKSALRLMGELGYRGIVDMGFRYDARDGQYKVLDVNPRLGSTFRLFVSENQIDVVRALHLDLTCRPVPPTRTQDGRTWIDEPSDISVSAKLVRERSLGLRAWMRSLKGIDEAAWWASDDPAPFVAMAGRYGVHALRAAFFDK